MYIYRSASCKVPLLCTYIGLLHVKYRYSCKILREFEFFSTDFQKSQIPNLIKIHPVVPCGRTDGQDMTKLIVVFRNFPKAPTNWAPTNRTERRSEGTCDQAQGQVAGARREGGGGCVVAERPAGHGIS
jgi:hypothetical protein